MFVLSCLGNMIGFSLKWRKNECSFRTSGGVDRDFAVVWQLLLSICEGRVEFSIKCLRHHSEGRCRRRDVGEIVDGAHAVE